MDGLAVGIISNRRLIRKALRCLLLTFPVSCKLRIAVDADSIDDSSETIVDLSPDVLLIDDEGVADCFASVRKLRTLSPSTKPLLLSSESGEKFAIEAVRSGAWGLLGKESDPDLLQQAIQKLCDGEMWFSHGTMSMAIQSFANHERTEHSPFDRLTPRETEVLSLLARGCHNKEIASRLFLSESTVKTYVKAIYRKLKVNSRVEAVLVYNGNAAAERVELDILASTLSAAEDERALTLNTGA